MLCLTRGIGESVIIETPYGPVEVTVTKIGRNGVQLGFTADKRVKIDREELYSLDADSANSKSLAVIARLTAPLRSRLRRTISLSGNPATSA